MLIKTSEVTHQSFIQLQNLIKIKDTANFHEEREKKRHFHVERVPLCGPSDVLLGREKRTTAASGEEPRRWWGGVASQQNRSSNLAFVPTPLPYDPTESARCFLGGPRGQRAAQPLALTEVRSSDAAFKVPG